MTLNVHFLAVNMPASYFNWKNIDANGEFIAKRKRSYETGYPSPTNSSARDANAQGSGPNFDNGDRHVSKRQRIVVDLSIQPPRRTWMATVIRPRTITPPTPTTPRRPKRGRFVRTKPSMDFPNRYHWESPSPSIVPKVDTTDEVAEGLQYPLVQDVQDVNGPTRSSLEPLFDIPRSAIYHHQAPEAPASTDDVDSESESDSEYDHAYTQESEEIQAQIEYYQQAIMSHERMAKIQTWSECTWLEGNIAPEFDSQEALLIDELSTVDFLGGRLAVEDGWGELVYPSEPEVQQQPEPEPEPEWVWMMIDQFAPVDRGVEWAVCCKCARPCPCYC